MMAALYSLETNDNIDLGAPYGDLGTHSVRKFADTYASNIPGGPLKDSVKHRAGHSLGKVQDIYDYLCLRTIYQKKFLQTEMLHNSATVIFI